jgi:hypothetical protein
MCERRNGARRARDEKKKGEEERLVQVFFFFFFAFFSVGRNGATSQTSSFEREKKPIEMILASSPAGGFVRPLRALPPRRTAPAARIVSSVRKFGAERPPLLLTRAEKDDESPSSSPTPSSSSALSNISTPSSSSTSDAADVDVDDPFFTDDEETAWLTQFLPFSRLSLDAATWLAANAERETLSPGQKVLVPGAFLFF